MQKRRSFLLRLQTVPKREPKRCCSLVQIFHEGDERPLVEGQLPNLSHCEKRVVLTFHVYSVNMSESRVY